MTVFINREDCEHVRIANDSGADVAQYEFAVVGPFAAIADEAIVSNAVGSFAVEEGIQFQTDDLQTSEDTFAIVGAPVYWDKTTGKFSDTLTEGYYRIGFVVLAKDGNGVIVVEKQRYATLIPATLVDIQAEVTAIQALAGIPFKKTVTLTALAAGTPVDILTDAQVGAGKKAYVTSFLSKVNGATAWTDATATIVKIQDSSATVGVTVAKAQMTGNAILGLQSTGVTLGDAVVLGAGFTTAKGLVIVADANFTAGSDYVVTVTGFVA